MSSYLTCNKWGIIVKNVIDLITRVPKEMKEEFSRNVCQENSFRFVMISLILMISESILLVFFRGSIFNTCPLVISFIIFNILYFPLIWKTYRNQEKYHKYFVRCVQFIYIVAVMLFGCALSILPQNQFASINPYIMAVFGLSVFVYTPPVVSSILFFSVYFVFFLALPYYQPNPQAVEILRINALIMNILGWIMSRMVYRMKIMSFTDKKTIEEINLELKDLVMRDSMTLLLNHENIFLRLTDEIERAKRIHYPLSLIMIDIDHFKEINDRFGHQAGDDVIIKVAQILNSTCRTTDVIGRYGGDEFLIIMPDTKSEDAVVLAERIRNTIEKTNFIKGIEVTVSGGITEFLQESSEELISSVDAKLYRAKENGRNRFEYENRTDL
ncbi:MAG: GGDEF domain-containing protein [Peptococcaceae bacterium]|nr:GGDEF domain-containing protein [Peptococcaceae bacterium]